MMENNMEGLASGVGNIGMKCNIGYIGIMETIVETTIVAIVRRF